MKKYEKWYNEIKKYFNCEYSEMVEIIESNGFEFLYDLMKYFEDMED